MISFATPLAIGNAVQVIVAPDSSAVRWVVLRKTSADFAGWDDPDAGVVADSAKDDRRSFVDIKALTNGTAYYYCQFETVDGETWSASDVVTVTPAANYGIIGPDPLSLVRDRLEAFLKAAVASQQIRHKKGYVPVLTAPPQYQEDAFPVVTVHLRTDANSADAIGQEIAPDFFDAQSGGWFGSEGYMSRVDLQVIVWSLNPDERIKLRILTKAGIIGNFRVFDDAGMVNFDLSFTDIEDMDSYDAPVYQSVASFGCEAPFVVGGTGGVVTDVEVTAIPFNPYQESLANG